MSSGIAEEAEEDHFITYDLLVCLLITGTTPLSQTDRGDSYQAWMNTELVDF